MYLVIYEKKNKRILTITKYTEGMVYGYSDNCAEAIVNEKPKGKFFNIV